MPESFDYTPFLYHPEPEREREKNIKEQTCEEGVKKKRGKRRIKKLFSVLFTVLLCFTFVFLCADFFGKGVLTDAVKEIFTGTEYTYYVVCKGESSRFTAYADSLEIRQTGGAGYIYSDDGFFVAYAVYIDKASAVAVQKKNPTATVQTVSYFSKEESSKEIDAMVADFCDGLQAWERGEMTESDWVTLRDTYHATLESQKATTQTLTPVLTLACDGLSDMNFSSCDKLALLSEIRYFLCCIVFSASESK